MIIHNLRGDLSSFSSKTNPLVSTAGVFGGRPPQDRDIILFMRGDVGYEHRAATYSRSIRQAYARISKYGLSNASHTTDSSRLNQTSEEKEAYGADSWAVKYRIWVGSNDEVPGEYNDLLSRSIFCLIAPGTALVLLFSKFNKFFFGYVDPENIILDNKSK